MTKHQTHLRDKAVRFCSSYTAAWIVRWKYGMGWRPRNIFSLRALISKCCHFRTNIQHPNLRSRNNIQLSWLPLHILDNLLSSFHSGAANYNFQNVWPGYITIFIWRSLLFWLTISPRVYSSKNLYWFIQFTSSTRTYCYDTNSFSAYFIRPYVW